MKNVNEILKNYLKIIHTSDTFVTEKFRARSFTFPHRT